MQQPQRKVRVSFFHPDLGIGGAERLVVDAALALQQRGCDVTLFTSHWSRAHCFPETSDGTLRVVVRGDWLPRSVCGRLHVLCAVLRALWLALCAALRDIRVAAGGCDVAVVDQLSATVPLLRALTRARVLFYCHFPDKLLAPRCRADDRRRPASLLRRLYRKPFDALEEWSTRAADAVVVNSNFTARVFAQAFPSILRAPSVVYPSVVPPPKAKEKEAATETTTTTTLKGVPDGRMLVVSINRFERKKNVGLALDAMAGVRELVGAEVAMGLHLVLAGGYDPRVRENVDYLEELADRAERLGLAGQVTFLPNFTTEQRALLLERAACLVYTPENEHFGIVPIEAMHAGVPVVACASGGPLETVEDGVTGFLRRPVADEFADAIARLAADRALAMRMGKAGRARVQERFSFANFGDQFHAAVMALLPQPDSAADQHPHSH